MKKILNNIVPVFVVLIIMLIIIPLPPFMLDLMLIINISLSFIILFTTMSIKESLEFSIFPSLLLITTLFRLGLNISSTRLILLEQGNAGKVVRTFGEFVIRDSPVVGFVIFIIIVIVQFLVITKGSERVAEVAARFTLDAMPGKQMAIDADLSSGLIDEATARTRRSKVQREADFFGAMDGASKFVKGDAIISIVVTLVNLIGGTIIGFIEHMGSFSEILGIFATSTVGDGLVSQLPALLISTATGMMVTRSASEENLNTDVKKQFTSQPRVLIMAGSVVLCLLLIPGFPPVQLITVGGSLITMGILLSRKPKVAEEEIATEAHTEEITSDINFYKDINNVYGLLNVEPIEMEFGYSLIPLVDEGSGGSFIDRVVMFRKQFAMEMGIVVPSVSLKDSGQLNPNQYTIKLKGEIVAQGDVLVDHFLALAPNDGGAEQIDGIDTIEPAFGIPARWISEDKKVKAELAGYTLIDPTSVIITHLSEVIRGHIYELLNRQEVQNLLENLKATNETIVSEVVPAVISLSDLQKVLSNLLRERVPIRDMQTILETLGDYGTSIRDTDILTEYTRQALKRTISHKFSEANQLRVISVDSEIEDMIMSAIKKSEHGSYLALDPNTIQRIITATSEQIDKVKNAVQVPIILTSPITRLYLKKLLDQFFPSIVVLSYSEVETNIQIQALGSVSLNSVSQS